MTRTPDPRITKATPGPAGKPCGQRLWADFCRGPTAQPSLFPVWPEGVLRAFPKLRDLTWETPKFRPAPYLQTALDRALGMQLQQGCAVRFPHGQLSPLSTHCGRCGEVASCTAEGRFNVEFISQFGSDDRPNCGACVRIAVLGTSIGGRQPMGVVRHWNRVSRYNRDGAAGCRDDIGRPVCPPTLEGLS